MTLEQIKSNSTNKREFLKKIVATEAKEPNKYLMSDGWIKEINCSGDFAREVAVEEGYIISYWNKEILRPCETKNGRPFVISVWEAVKNDNEAEVHYAYDWEM